MFLFFHFFLFLFMLSFAKRFFEFLVFETRMYQQQPVILNLEDGPIIKYHK